MTIPTRYQQDIASLERWTIAEAIKRLYRPRPLVNRKSVRSDDGQVIMPENFDATPWKVLNEDEAIAQLKEDWSLGRLVVWGRTTRTQYLSAIDPPTDLSCARFEVKTGSLKLEERGKMRTVCDLRAVPTIFSPDVVSRLDRVSLAEVFREHILGSIEVCLYKDGVFKTEAEGDFADARHHTIEMEKVWPCGVSGHSLLEQWQRPSLYASGLKNCKDYPDCLERAAIALYSAYGRLLHLLTSGALRAFGYKGGGYEQAEIRRSVWNDYGLYLDSESGDILFDAAPRGALRDLRFLWTSVELEAPGQTYASEWSRVAGDLGEKARKGRRPTHCWQEAMDEMVIELANTGPPGTQAELINLVIKKFEEIQGEAPDESQIRKYLNREFPKLAASVRA